MTKLSVNINKIATLRNSRGSNTPDLLNFARKVQDYGAQGITVHPRPDERHIRYSDVFDLKDVVNTEFNIEGNPSPRFMDMLFHVRPTQVTLVPDTEDVLTSNAGWDTVKHYSFLKRIISELKSYGIRTSIFVDPQLKFIEGAKKTGADRIELYTEEFASQYDKGNFEAIDSYVSCAQLAHSLGIGINAGHDLSLKNIRYFKEHIPHLLEVSIGHALISESLYLGVKDVVALYLNKLQ